jgi:hypothetical protein
MADIGTLNPEQMLQQQQILRQQKMAEMLMQQGAQQPQAQIVGGRYVAPSIFQNLAGLANQYVGQRGLEKAEQAQVDLAKQLREQGVQETQRLMNTFSGRPAIAGTPDVPTETYETVRGTPAQAAIAANPKLAYAEAINMQSPQARALLPFLAAEAFKKPKWEKASFTDEKTGRTREGVIDVNSENPISTFMVGGVKPEMSAYERASLNMRGAELADQGISGFGGGGNMPMNQVRPQGQPQGVPMGQPQGQPQGQPKGQPSYLPSTMPVYQNDPSLSPKQNREQAAEFSKANRKLAENAKSSFDVLKEAASILSSGNPSSGRGENIVTGAREFFGGGGKTSEADAILTIYGTKLTQQVPRFEGPQSDKDTALYTAAGGDVGNPNKPIQTRLAAVKTMIDINKKYYPNGDWDSIDLAGPVTTKQTFLKGTQTIDPATFSQGLNAQDKEAFNWARKNPTDPRAAQINQRLGIR